jgi:FlaA1/EpsC-like NDP-sugar epimerase
MKFDNSIVFITQFLRSHPFLRRAVIIGWHILGTCLTYYLAFYLRFEGRIPPESMACFFHTLPVLLCINLVVFMLFRLYAGMWSFFSIDDLLRIIGALGTALLIFAGYITLRAAINSGFSSFQLAGFPRSVWIVYFMFMAGWMTGARLTMRWVRERRAERTKVAKPSDKRALVVGGLQDAEHVIRGAQDNNAVDQFVGIVTDEAHVRHLTIRGVRIYGPVTDIGKVAVKTNANCILILPPYTRPKQINAVMDDCEKEGAACVFHMIPTVADLTSGRVELSALRKVELEDLLGRPEITFNRQSVREALAGKVIMITGAGGSIGSELARQVAHYAPRHLVLFENNEYSLYSVDLELKKNMAGLSFSPVAGDISHAHQVQNVLRQYGVQVVYHAAAYKHVPIMEDNASACILNNTIGTARLVEEAEKYGVERFVLISSDKAVRPASVMGASKRLAEYVIQERPLSNVKFCIVRFGNVLGSSGSVIPLFRRQIEDGGPLTVTTPDMTRFFMSIPEAVDLVLQASVIGNDRDIMVLEMGQPVRVADMARRLIELSGLRAGEDIEIVYTGIRPGEKEFEELMTDNESVVRTPFEKIWVMQKSETSSLPPLDLALLTDLAEKNNEPALRHELMRLIPDAYPLSNG